MLLFAVPTEQNDRADLVAQLGATSEALRTKIDDLAQSGATCDADLETVTASTRCPVTRVIATKTMS